MRLPRQNYKINELISIMVKTSTSLNIVLLPNEKTYNLAIELSNELSKKVRTNFILNGKDLIPHLTIYQAEFPDENKSKVLEEVYNIVKNLHPFTLDMGGFSSTPEGNIWWNSIFTEPMATLQKESIKKCNHLRNNLIIPGLENLIEKGEDYKNEITKYGSLWLYDRYVPHISLTSVEQKHIDLALQHLNFEKKISFKSEKIAVGKLGKNGTVTSIIKEFPIT